mgnify:FL=1
MTMQQPIAWRYEVVLVDRPPHVAEEREDIQALVVEWLLRKQ